MMDKEKEIRKEERREREKGRVLNYNAGWWLGKKEKWKNKGGKQREREEKLSRTSVNRAERAVSLTERETEPTSVRTNDRTAAA